MTRLLPAAYLALLVPRLLPALTITEVMYHAPGGRDLEYVEIHNETTEPLDLAGYYFASGVGFVFRERLFLDPGAYIVVCASAARIREAYGIENAAGDWSASTGLDNDGEEITIANPSGAIEARLRYRDRGPWPGAADGAGHSLELRDPRSDPEDPANWGASVERGGSPGWANPGRAGPPAPVINEALLLAPADARWIELYNPGAAAFDLSGSRILEERGGAASAPLPAGSIIPPRGRLSLGATDLGLELAPAAGGELFLALEAPAGGRVLDAHTFAPRLAGRSEARIPDGGPLFQPAAAPTRDLPNRAPPAGDLVINEIHYHPLDGSPDLEFVELHNRGAAGVDLEGWRLDGGLRFAFPRGAAIAAGGYAVAARDPALLRAAYALPAATAVFGPEDAAARADLGALSDRSETLVLLDPDGNRADAVHYDDGGEWPGWADGGGSSLERIDPWQESGAGQTWDASDEAEKAPVEEISYSGRFTGGAGAGAELHLALADEGIVLVDDIELRERSTVVVAAATFIENDAAWKHFPARAEATEPPERWRGLEFDDAAWPAIQAPVGYGTGDEAAPLDDMRGSYLAIFLRRAFEVADPAAVTGLLLEVEYDDGFAAYLNGVEVVAANLGESRAFDARALSARSDTVRLVLDARNRLRPGRNVLAVQVHNASLTSPDLRFRARLLAGRLEDRLGSNLVTDGTFEAAEAPSPTWPAGSANAAWLLQGNHIRSGRTTAAPLGGAASLKIVATGGGDNKVNRIETSDAGLAPLTAGAEYRISFRARWVAGSPALLTHGAYRGSQPPSYAAAHRLAAPRAAGTPGAMNSVSRREVRRSGAANLGPVITDVRQIPAVPRPGEAVLLRARITDPDGVAAASVRYSFERPRAADDPELLTLPMSGPDGDGIWSAAVPGQPAGRRVVLSIAAADTGGREGRWPLDHLRRTHPLVLDPDHAAPADARHLVYRHDEAGAAGRYPAYRFTLDAATEEYLAARLLLSNDLAPATLVVAGRDVHPGTGIRFAGSPFARNAWTGSYRVRPPKDRPLRGVAEKFNLEEHQGAGGRDARERISSYLIRYGQGSTRVPYARGSLVELEIPGRVRGAVKEECELPGGDLLRRWYPGDDEGPLFEVDDRHQVSDIGGREASQDARLLYPPYGPPAAGEDREEYRYYFNPREDGGADDWSGLIALARLMTPAVTSNAEFDARVEEVVDVEEFCRLWAVRLNTDDWDSWGARRGKNCYLYLPPAAGRWALLPWDMELTYGDDSTFLPPALSAASSPTYVTNFLEVTRFLNRPRLKRLYYGAMKEMIDGPFRPEFLAPYLERLAAAGYLGTAAGEPGGFIDRRRRLLAEIVRGVSAGAVAFRVTTNGGLPLETAAIAVEVAGTAPVEVASIAVLLDGQQAGADFAARFSATSVLGWTAAGALAPGRHRLDFIGFTTAGDIAATTSFEVAVAEGSGARFLRGDANLSGKLEIADALLVLFAAAGEASPPCADAADADDDGAVGLADALTILDYLFLGGAPPRPPFPERGADPTPGDGLGCEAEP